MGEGSEGSNRQELNESEWRDPDNWTLPIGFYFSKKDDRWLVPRPSSHLGWTFNLGHPRGALALLLSFVGPLVLQAALVVLLAFVLWRECGGA